MAFNKKYKILLIEPSEIIAKGLKDIFAKCRDMEVIDVMTKLDDYNQFGYGQVDIIVVNPLIFGHNNIKTVRSFFNEGDIAMMVAIENHPLKDNILNQFDAIINIYDSVDEIKQKMSSVLKKNEDSPKKEKDELTPRERDILKGVAKGLTNKEIAFEYNISIYTVTTHRKNISRKLGINSISGLTVYAIMNKFVDMSDFD